MYTSYNFISVQVMYMHLLYLSNTLLSLLDFCFFVCSDKKLTEEKFIQLVQQKYQRSLAEPGEAVGLLAAQVS